MSGIEQTLLNTLSKGDARDIEFRKRVYNSAANALKRSLEAKGALPPETVQAQKDKLADAIRSVESRFQSVPAPAAEPSPVRDQPDQPARPAPTPRPELRPEPRAEARPAIKPAEPDKKSTLFRLKRGPFAAGLGTIALVGILVLGLLWVMVSGAFQSEEARDTSVPNPPADTGSEDFAPRDPGTSTAPPLRADAATETDWVTIFTPDDLPSLTLTGGATAEAASDPFGRYVRIITPATGTAAIDLPVGPLQDLAGQRAQIEITAKAADGDNTQMAVTCGISNVECVRTRFGVGQAEEAFIYRVDLSNAGRISQPGRLILQSDIVGSGKEIKLISLRVRPEQ
ncbi:MAG: hypothetical protein AAGG69_12555 [Pseudomonadota bacterium]